MWYGLLVFIHIVACAALILIVLLQTGKGAEMGAAFGGASQTLFGGSGGNTFLSKLTTGAAIVFMLTCLWLTLMAAGPQTSSIMEKVPATQPAGPALPEAKPVQPMQQPATPAPPVTAPEAKAPAAASQSEQAAPAPAPKAPAKPAQEKKP